MEKLGPKQEVTSQFSYIWIFNSLYLDYSVSHEDTESIKTVFSALPRGEPGLHFPQPGGESLNWWGNKKQEPLLSGSWGVQT